MKKRWLAAFVFGAFSGNSSASGFALIEQNADGLGNAYAGGAASAENASTVYFNPAGLTLLEGNQWVASLHVINPSVRFSDRNSTTAGAPLSGGDGESAGHLTVIPNFFFSHELNDRTKFGFGVNTPFGLGTDYKAGWKGRYQALKSDLQTLNLNPSLAYKVNDTWSIGAGLDLQYAKAELSSAVDFGTLCVGLLGAGACAPSNTLPQSADGTTKMTGDGWAWGYNLGILYSPTVDTRYGMAYRSHIDHKLRGDVRFTKPATLPAPLASSLPFSDTSAKADLNVPDIFSLSAFHQASKRWAVMADLTWTGWSRFNELRIRMDNGAPDSVTPENWHDTYRVALGALYRQSDAWSFRLGVAFDQSPVSDQYRTACLPDADRTWLAFGAQYRLSTNSRMDVGYTHLFVKNADINITSATRGNLIGGYQSHSDVLSAQYSQAF